MSFKYRFILSFVLLEIVFIILIVTVNFQAITNSSKQLIDKEINTNISFMKQLLKVPMSIYDLATLDNLVENSVNMGFINSLVILDSKNRVLSESYNYELESLDNILKVRTDTSVEMGNKSFELRYVEMIEDEVFLGSFYLIFDTSENSIFIQQNKQRTFFIVLLEILISTIMSYVIGSNLTKKLTRLSEVTQEIGENKIIEMPYLKKNDEIGILSNSLNNMQYALKERNNKLKEFASQLKSQKNDLILANKAKDDFLANMSHELKTPLNSINVISSVMMKNKNQTLTEEQVKNISIINNCGHDLLTLINDVLDVSKLEAGEIELYCETIDLKELINEMHAMFDTVAYERNLKLIFEYDETIQYIYSDKKRLKQIIKNLLSNAIKFTPKGEIRLSVTAHEQNVRISVQDEGIGIEKEKLDHIFDRFKQADSSTTRKFGGTGLGLAICKELSKLLEGTLTVSSEVDKGTTFVLTVPKNEHRIEKTQSVHEGAQKATEVLVLNNNPIEMMNFIIALTKDFNVIQVSSIADLIDKMQQKHFDYVIIDMRSSLESDITELIEQHNSAYVFLYENSLPATLNDKAVKSFDKSFDYTTIIELLKA